MRFFPVITLTGCIAIVALAMNPAAAEQWQFDRHLIHSGEFWRLPACNWAHWSISHAAWSAGAFALLGGICEAFSRRLTILVIATSAVAIPLTILIFIPSVAAYRGVSGIDSAMFGALAVLLWRTGSATWARRAWVIVATLLFAAKLLWECLTHSPAFAAAGSGLAPLPQAHLAGFLSGVLVTCYYPIDRSAEHTWQLPSET